MRYFVHGFICIVVGYSFFAALPFALGLIFFGTPESRHTLNTLQEKISPDGSYLATSYVDTGGGAAGWCTAEVNVRKAGSELSASNKIFAAHCGTMVDLSWNSENVLQVAYIPDDERFGVSQHAWALDRTVKIVYFEVKPADNKS